MASPFKPTFGSSPPLLVGREEISDLFAEGIEDGPGASNRATIYTGLRGMGKTAMLNEVQRRAMEQGWLVIAETVTVGFVDRIVKQHLPALLREHDPEAQKHQVTGVATPFGGADWGTSEKHVPEWGLRNQITLLTDILASHGTGLLITLDEIHRMASGEMQVFTAELQHTFREGGEVAFAGAGLPSAVSDLLNDEVSTFLRRAERHTLGEVRFMPDVMRAISEPIEESGRKIADDLCLMAARATKGYPFLIQLVGDQIWRQHPKETTITLDDVQTGVDKARRRLGSLVHAPTLKPTSAVDRSFLVAMAQDNEASEMGNIQRRLGVSESYAGQYRLRLIEAGLIYSVGHGRVDFVLPDLREYLREHATSLPRFETKSLNEIDSLEI